MRGTEAGSAAAAVDSDGPRAWSLDFSAAWKTGNDCTPAGWAWGHGGEECFVSQDSCAGGDPATCDSIIAVEVDGADGWAGRFGVPYQGDVGWGRGREGGGVVCSAGLGGPGGAGRRAE